MRFWLWAGVWANCFFAALNFVGVLMYDWSVLNVIVGGFNTFVAILVYDTIRRVRQYSY